MRFSTSLGFLREAGEAAGMELSPEGCAGCMSGSDAAVVVLTCSHMQLLWFSDACVEEGQTRSLRSLASLASLALFF